MKLTIKVTTKDIRGARRGNPRMCPIARAFRRTIATKDVVVTLYDAARVETKGLREGLPFVSLTWVALPRLARRFIDRFDGGHRVKPFRFQVRAPSDLPLRAKRRSVIRITRAREGRANKP